MLQTPLGLEQDDSENEKFKFCSVHIQTWTYIHCGVSIFVALCAICAGILALIWPEWHEWLVVYRQYLAYARRSNPVFYWLCYKIFFVAWIFVHVTHFITIIATIVGIQTIKPLMILPQKLHLMLQLGVLLLVLAAVLIISSTATRAAYATTLLTLAFLIPVSTNLFVLVLFNDFLREKADALEAVLASTKQVHFQEK